jgi:hypothetical protein
MRRINPMATDKRPNRIIQDFQRYPGYTGPLQGGQFVLETDQTLAATAYALAIAFDGAALEIDVADSGEVIEYVVSFSCMECRMALAENGLPDRPRRMT